MFSPVGDRIDVDGRYAFSPGVKRCAKSLRDISDHWFEVADRIEQQYS